MFIKHSMLGEHPFINALQFRRPSIPLRTRFTWKDCFSRDRRRHEHFQGARECERRMAQMRKGMLRTTNGAPHATELVA